MKSEEFAALAKAATPGEWHFNEALSPKYDRDASFWIWCANNRSLIIRALRTQEACEKKAVRSLENAHYCVNCGTVSNCFGDEEDEELEDEEEDITFDHS